MLTQGPAPDPKCKLIISSFLKLPHLLDCLICWRKAMSIVLLVKIIGDGIGGRWFIFIRVWVGVCMWGGGGDRVVYHLIVFVFFLCFCIFCLTFSVPLCKWLEYDGCCVCFFVFSLISLFLVPITRSC